MTWALVTAAAGVVAAELLSTSTIVLVAAAAGPAPRWRSVGGRTPATATHAHAAALATGGWATAASVWGADNQWVAAGLAAATAAVGIPWWLNHAVRDHIEQVRERERWPEIAAQLQMVGSKMLRRTKLTDAATGREIGWEALIQLRPGDTASTLAAKRTQLESLWGLRIGSVQVGKVVENARRATVTVVDTDVFAMKGDITHPALSRRVGARLQDLDRSDPGRCLRGRHHRDPASWSTRPSAPCTA